MEPWIGWIRLTDGRRQTGGHPGTAWLTPPLHPAPGREGEQFAMVLDLTGPAPSRLYREIRDAAAQAFWSTPGSSVAALRRAVIAANRALVHFNHPLPSESRCMGSMVCAALRADEVFLAHAGPAWSGVLSADGDEQHPGRPLPHLGSRPYAEIALSYVPVRPGLTLLLSTQNLLHLVAPDALGQVLRREGEDILDGLEQLAGEESLTAMVLRWPEGKPTPPPAPPSPRRREAPSQPEVPPPPPPPPEEARMPEELLPPEEPTPWEGGAEREAEWVEPGVWTRVTAPPSPRPAPKFLRLGEAVGAGFTAIGRGLARGASAVGGGLVRGVSAVGAGLGAAAGAVYHGARVIFRRALPGAERRRTVGVRVSRPVPQENPRRMAALAIVILILVLLTTLIVWFRYGRDLRRGEVLSRAREQVLAAQQAPHPELARPHWEAVLALTANNNDPEVRALHSMAQDALDQMDGVIRVAPTLLADLGTQVSRNRLVAWEQSVAVLEGPGRVRRVLVGGGSELISIPGAPPLIDITAHQSGPGQPSLGLLVLGAGGHLWAYDPHWSEPRSVALSLAPGGHDPVAIATYAGRLYLLDPAAGQIWRYIPQNGEFREGPEPYFSSEAPPLTGARDMALNYSIYLLFEDGGVARYEEGRAAPFAVSGVPAPAAHFTALTVDPEREKGPVYLADGAAERIVVLREDGAFCAQFRPPGEEFRGLQALTVSQMGDSLFVLARGRIYRVTIPPLPCR
ncbi:MAG: hypothetical protein H5T61_13290 [Thermoflexales bacterium]|nr:hypothetical protein [Thermoflexales bacterium]